MVDLLIVITNAGYNNPNVKGLVYVAAIAPREGQSMTTSLPPFPKEFEGKPLLIFDKGGFAYINPALFHDFFVQDVNQAQAKVLAVVQKPRNISGIVNEKSVLQLGSKFRHGIKSLRTTEPFLLLSNICSQNRSMLLYLTCI